METKVQVEQVMDDARRINQVVARGNYGADAARLWGYYGAASMTLLAHTDFSRWRFEASNGFDASLAASLCRF